MSTRVEDKDGNGYVFMTPQEAQDKAGELLKFESPAHAQAFFDHLNLTPEALEQLYRRVMDELAQHADTGSEGRPVS